MHSKLLLNKKKIMFILAIGAGALLCFPSVHAMPEQEGYITPGVNINTIQSTMNITGSNQNNVINWKSFNVGDNETVQFDNGQQGNNYLNLIHDSKASEIYGTIIGGNNVYLINPNGFLFGDNSSINVGNLYISTRTLSDEVISNFTNGNNPLSITTTNFGGDIVNLGTMQANQVVLEGNNVTLTNNINTVSEMAIKAKSDINIGFADGDVSKEINAKQFTENINASAFLQNISCLDLNGNPRTDITPYYLVRNVYELQNMQNNLKGNFMLANDIDASITKDWNNGSGFTPIGSRKFIEEKQLFVSPYTGKSYYETVRTQQDSLFSGNFIGFGHSIKGLYINRPTEDHIGLFGLTENCEIDNVHMTGSAIKGRQYVGSLVGYNNNGIIKGYNTGDVSGMYVGGLVGFNNDGQVTGVNNGNVNGIALLDEYIFEGEGENRRYVGSRQVEQPADYVGGLVGYSGRRDSSAGIEKGIVKGINQGNVNGNRSVGGLVGANDAAVIGKNKGQVSGNVSGNEAVGSLVGESYGSVEESELSELKLFGKLVNTVVANDISKINIEAINSAEDIINDINKLHVELPINGITTKKLSSVGKISSQKLLLERNEIPSEEQPMAENNFSSGVKAADSITQSNIKDFQNFSKSTTLVGETIQATMNNEETASSRKKLIMKD